MFFRNLYTCALAAITGLQLASAGPLSHRDLAQGPAITYSPYGGTAGNSRCKTAVEVASDINRLKDYKMIRLYGQDCDQVKNVLPVAKQCGMKLFLGIYNVDDMDNEVNMLATTMGSDWGSVHTVSVGNEFVLQGKKTAQQMVDLTNEARTKLRAKGYQGYVVSVNVFVDVLQNPLLCEGQDYIAVNCHPFFDGNVTPEQAGTFVKNMRQQVSDKCGGKYTMITETGWPHAGGANGQCVPSKENQLAALQSIKQECGNDVVYFTAFDDLWKADNPATHGAEKYWGILPTA